MYISNMLYNMLYTFSIFDKRIVILITFMQFPFDIEFLLSINY